MADNEQQPQDPIAPFVNGGQSTQQGDKYTFAGQEWDSKEACEQAYAKAWPELQAKANAALQQQPQQQSTVTGRESIDYEYNGEKFSKEWLPKLATDPRQALAEQLNLLVWGRPTAPPGMNAHEVIRQGIASGLKSSAELDAIKLRAEHPEVNFSHPDTLRAIAELRTQYGLADNFAGNDAAIALAQTKGRVPSRQHMEAYLQAQRQQQYQQPQQSPFTLPQTSEWQVYGSAGDIPQGVVPIRPPVGPPAMGRVGANSTPTLNVQALLDKIDDPATSVADAKKLRDSLQEWQQKNPTAVGY